MLKKLSLAALVAMGGISFANATPLTEAIKNVDLSGMLRIRFYAEQPETGDSYNKWRTNGVFIFKIPVAENINFIFRNSTQTYLSNTESNDGKIVKTADQVDSTVVNNLLFMNYHQDGLNAIAGKIPVATPITSIDPATPTHGAGAIATYSFGNGFTVAGGFVTAMKNVAGVSVKKADDWNGTAVITNYQVSSNYDNYHYIGNVLNNDTYVLAGIYGNDAVKAQVWYFHVENLLKYDVIASADLDLLKLANIQNNYDVKFHVDYAASKYEDNIVSNADTKQFANINITGKVAGADLRVGYAKSGSENGVIDLSVDSPLAYSQAHTQQYYDIANAYDCDMFYADGSYKVTPAVKLTLAYDHVNGNSNNTIEIFKNNLNEYTAQVDYAYNKKLSFQAYYDYADSDISGKDNTEVRAQALYKF